MEYYTMNCLFALVFIWKAVQGIKNGEVRIRGKKSEEGATISERTGGWCFVRKSNPAGFWFGVAMCLAIAATVMIYPLLGS